VVACYAKTSALVSTRDRLWADVALRRLRHQAPSYDAIDMAEYFKYSVVVESEQEMGVNRRHLCLKTIPRLETPFSMQHQFNPREILDATSETE
jgi:hypothetical protein